MTGLDVVDQLLAQNRRGLLCALTIICRYYFFTLYQIRSTTNCLIFPDLSLLYCKENNNDKMLSGSAVTMATDSWIQGESLVNVMLATVCLPRQGGVFFLLLFYKNGSVKCTVGFVDLAFI